MFMPLLIVEWAALGLVAVVTIVAASIMVVLVAGAAALLTRAAELDVFAGMNGGTSVAGKLRGTAYALLTVAGLGVLYGIYLIIPYFH